LIVSLFNGGTSLPSMRFLCANKEEFLPLLIFHLMEGLEVKSVANCGYVL